MEIKIMSIADLLHVEHLKNSYRSAILFISTKPNYYDFGSTLFYMLDIPDIDTPVIKGIQLRLIKHILDCATEIDTLYVCCDAGLSRSPAMGYFIAKQIGDDEQAKTINQKYGFLNIHLLRKLKEVSVW